MKIAGYSERGLINSLLYEIAYSSTPELILSRLLSRAHFPSLGEADFSIRSAEVLVEQSLSDFGDADAIFLLVTASGSISVFVEAKVKPWHVPNWRMASEFQRFMQGTETVVRSSNLFTQLYHKVRLADSLKFGATDELEAGLPFPACSTKRRRRIGDNRVVRAAIDRLKNYLDSVYYLALVPDDATRVSEFFRTVLRDSNPPGHVGWDTSSYGHLSWHEIERFCEEHGMDQTLSVFDFNRGQIY